MAGRIAGITIELNGDPTNLIKSLKSVDTELNKTQSALKDIDKLLKLNPGNVDLLTQKQRNLKEGIEQTKTRLEELKTAQSQFGEGTAEYDAIQREIIETEGKLKGLEQEFSGLKSVAGGALQAVGDKISEVGDKMQEVGKTLTKNVTAPIVAAAGASVVAWKDVDSAYDTRIACRFRRCRDCGR